MVWLNVRKQQDRDLTRGPRDEGSIASAAGNRERRRKRTTERGGAAEGRRFAV